MPAEKFSSLCELHADDVDVWLSSVCVDVAVIYIGIVET